MKTISKYLLLILFFTSFLNINITYSLAPSSNIANINEYIFNDKFTFNDIVNELLKDNKTFITFDEIYLEVQKKSGQFFSQEIVREWIETFLDNRTIVRVFTYDNNSILETFRFSNNYLKSQKMEWVIRYRNGDNSSFNKQLGIVLYNDSHNNAILQSMINDSKTNDYEINEQKIIYGLRALFFSSENQDIDSFKKFKDDINKILIKLRFEYNKGDFQEKIKIMRALKLADKIIQNKGSISALQTALLYYDSNIENTVEALHLDKKIIELYKRSSLIKNLRFTGNRDSFSFINYIYFLIQTGCSYEQNDGYKNAKPDRNMPLLALASLLEELKDDEGLNNETISKRLELAIPISGILDLSEINNDFLDLQFEKTDGESRNFLKDTIIKVFGLEYEQLIGETYPSIINNIKTILKNDFPDKKLELKFRIKSLDSIWKKFVKYLEDNNISKSENLIDLEDNLKTFLQNEIKDILGVQIVFPFDGYNRSQETLETSQTRILSSLIKGFSLKSGDYNLKLKELGKKGYSESKITFLQNLNHVTKIGVEIQTLSEQDYFIYRYGEPAHWAYKLNPKSDKIQQNSGKDIRETLALFITKDPDKNYESLHKSVSSKLYTGIFLQDESGKIKHFERQLSKGSNFYDISSARTIDVLENINDYIVYEVESLEVNENGEIKIKEKKEIKNLSKPVLLGTPIFFEKRDQVFKISNTNWSEVIKTSKKIRSILIAIKEKKEFAVNKEAGKKIWNRLKEINPPLINKEQDIILDFRLKDENEFYELIYLITLYFSNVPSNDLEYLITTFVNQYISDFVNESFAFNNFEEFLLSVKDITLEKWTPSENSNLLNAEMDLNRMNDVFLRIRQLLDVFLNSERLGKGYLKFLDINTTLLNSELLPWSELKYIIEKLKISNTNQLIKGLGLKLITPYEVEFFNYMAKSRLYTLTFENKSYKFIQNNEIKINSALKLACGEAFEIAGGRFSIKDKEGNYNVQIFIPENFDENIIQNNIKTAFQKTFENNMLIFFKSEPKRALTIDVNHYGFDKKVTEDIKNILRSNLGINSVNILRSNNELQNLGISQIRIMIPKALIEYLSNSPKRICDYLYKHLDSKWKKEGFKKEFIQTSLNKNKGKTITEKAA